MYATQLSDRLLLPGEKGEKPGIQVFDEWIRNCIDFNLVSAMIDKDAHIISP